MKRTLYPFFFAAVLGLGPVPRLQAMTCELNSTLVRSSLNTGIFVNPAINGYRINIKELEDFFAFAAADGIQFANTADFLRALRDQKPALALQMRLGEVTIEGMATDWKVQLNPLNVEFHFKLNDPLQALSFREDEKIWLDFDTPRTLVGYRPLVEESAIEGLRQKLVMSLQGLSTAGDADASTILDQGITALNAMNNEQLQGNESLVQGLDRVYDSTVAALALDANRILPAEAWLEAFSRMGLVHVRSLMKIAQPRYASDWQNYLRDVLYSAERGMPSLLESPAMVETLADAWASSNGHTDQIKERTFTNPNEFVLPADRLIQEYSGNFSYSATGELIFSGFIFKNGVEVNTAELQSEAMDRMAKAIERFAESFPANRTISFFYQHKHGLPVHSTRLDQLLKSTAFVFTRSHFLQNEGTKKTIKNLISVPSTRPETGKIFVMRNKSLAFVPENDAPDAASEKKFLDSIGTGSSFQPKLLTMYATQPNNADAPVVDPNITRIKSLVQDYFVMTKKGIYAYQNKTKKYALLRKTEDFINAYNAEYLP